MNEQTIRGILFLLISAAICFMPLAAGADCDCSEDTAVPPFLTAGADPNLLMIIDNSASMLDLAYTSDATTCYDDSYSNANSYAGYFESATWYLYDFASDEFLSVADSAANTFCSASGTEYSSTYLCVDGTMTSDEMTAVSAVYATGNLLNWVSSSKLDIQKKILTGGKYDSTDGNLQMETRGCGNRRFIKEVPVDYSGVTHYVTFAVTPPKAPDYDAWEDATAYSIGDIVSNEGGNLYEATSAGTSNGSSPLDDAGVTWVEYWDTRWHNGTSYSAGDLVTDPTKANSIDDGRVYIALTSGTANGTGVDDDSGITWVTYDRTRIEIFAGTADGYDAAACQAVIDEYNSATPALGQITNLIDDCMEYSRTSGSGGAGSEDSNNAFNHSNYYCWYKAKHGDWPPGEGKNTAIQNDCQAIYDNGIDPWELNPDDRAYICYGRATEDPNTDAGYVGRCYGTGSGCTLVCTQAGKTVADCPAPKLEYQDSAGNTCTASVGWLNAGYGDVDGDGDADADDCIEQGLKDFCGGMEIPEVIDPSDQVGADTGASDVTWGLPAILTDSGVVAQLGEPLVTMEGAIEESAAPTGLLQENTDDIRMGAMVFNDSGSASECSMTDPYVLYECADPGNKDGGKVIQEIGQSSSHTTALVEAINDIKATSWTPLAEAFYNAIGYFKQDSALRLNVDDFTIGTNPIEYWCQNNNILIITEGASTADQNTDVWTLVSPAGSNDGDTDTSAGSTDCGALDGGTLLDDLSWYAKNTEGLLGQIAGENKSNIETYIVAAGTPRTDGTGECSPDTLLTSAAENGGTSLITASDMDELETALRTAFSAIRERAAAGSAASVISATRSGEGAVYQAIFWPVKTGPKVSGVQYPDVSWTGEVHALLMDADGNLYEDTDSNRTLNLDTDEHVIFYFDESENETLACYNGEAVNGACSGTSKDLDEVNYLWSAAEWLSGVDDAYIDINRSSYISGDQERYIYTWNDRSNDGIVDANEWLAFDDTTDWNGLTVAGTRGAMPYDFGVDPSASADPNGDVDDIVNWIRGEDAAGYRSRTLATPSNFDIGDDTITWRLGDVIYSTPTSVARPEENYHLVYRDDSYIDFVSKYKSRRHMVYFGANDGMIHAVNGGFYDATTNKFWKGYEDTNGDSVFEYTDPADAPALGAEMWAYVPYNLLPQLKCLRETSYDTNHKYFVDLKPRIFDVKIFDDTDPDHPNGWGTIMVAGMRFGGGSVDADAAGDTRKFVSAYMIFDITNPEEPPDLLGELTYNSATSAHMGYTTMVPVVTPMKETDPNTNVVSTKWYLILGSGPLVLDASGDWEYNTAIGGIRNQPGDIAVFPLSNLITSLGGDGVFRIPDGTPDATTAGVIPLMDAGADPNDSSDDTPVVGFVSDPISVDFDLDNDYRADAVYFGTVEGVWGGWGGRLYRLVTHADSGISDPSTWELKEMLNPHRPVTAAPMAGWDGQNFWVYFGTGRFLDGNDRSDASSMATETFYGLKEPVSCTAGTFEWPTLDVADLWPVGSIRVSESPDMAAAALSCYAFDSVTETYSDTGTTACLPTGVTTFSELDTYIAGTGCDANDQHTGMAGWKHSFDLTGERNLGQATLLGGLLTFTTYQPFDDLCRMEGEAYLYALYYRTGTSWHESVFDAGGSDPVVFKKDLGLGLATTPNLHVGKEEGGTAYAQTSTGAIVEIKQPNMPVDDVKTGRMYWRTD